MPANAASQELAQVNAPTASIIPVLWARVVVLLASGATIAFTATSHSDPKFSLLVMGVSLVMISLPSFGEFFVLRKRTASWLLAVKSAATLLAGVAMLVLLERVNHELVSAVGTAGQLPPTIVNQYAVSAATIIAVWAALSAGLKVALTSAKAEPRSMALPSAALSAFLAVMVLMTSDDFVAIIGFFGAYAIVRAVFLGIAVFDMKRPAASQNTPVAA